MSLFRHVLAIVVFLLTALAGRFADAAQPIAYPHKKHIDMGLACLDCHSTADTQASATLPSVRKCMLCHAKLGTDKPEIKKLASFSQSKREVPWERIYGFSTSASVKFQHAPHVRNGVQCATCHGDMANATTAQKLVNHNMGTCLTCHRQNKGPEDCAACHY